MSDKYTWEAGDVRVIKPAQCTICRHLRDDRRWTCAAFPKGIPAAILTNRADHTLPFPGDKGIRFDPKK